MGEQEGDRSIGMRLPRMTFMVKIILHDIDKLNTQISKVFRLLRKLNLLLPCLGLSALYSRIY